MEAEALERAEAECLADSEVRGRRREREVIRRSELDCQYVERFAPLVRELFLGCPAGRKVAITSHACFKISVRIGRLEAGKSLDEEAV